MRLLVRRRSPPRALVMTLVATVLLWLPAPSTYGAAERSSRKRIAGQLNGEAVTLGEVDNALGGTIVRLWNEETGVIRTAAREICRRRALRARWTREGETEAAWKRGVWTASVPSARAVESFLRDAPQAPGGERGRALAGHLLRVREYRRRVREAADTEIAGRFSLHPIEGAGHDEPRMPEVVATCMDAEISRDQVERFASFPLFRRRGQVVMSACSQFEIDYSNPLLLARTARREGLSTEQLLKRAERDAAPVAETEVRKLALERYGDTETASLARARMALGVVGRVDARMAFLERLLERSSGRCSLAMPEPPVVRPDTGTQRARAPRAGVAGEGVSVLYFASFDCRLCEAGWQSFERLRSRWNGRIEARFRHHFPETFLPAFEDALASECALRAGRLGAFARWRFASGADAHPRGYRTGLPVALGVDPDGFERCLSDPATAVTVLDDTEEALRLGFREAVPSWVIGERPRRGFQGDRILDETVEEQLRSRSPEVGEKEDRP